MDRNVTIPEPLAQSLHTIATQRGISIEALTEQVLVAGMAALQATPGTTDAHPEGSNRTLLLPPLRLEFWSLADTDPMSDQIVHLGTLHPAPLPDGFVFTMPSPIIAAAPVPTRTLVPVDDTLDTGTSHAD
jgi:hypothetical protein